MAVGPAGVAARCIRFCMESWWRLCVSQARAQSTSPMIWTGWRGNMPCPSHCPCLCAKRRTKAGLSLPYLENLLHNNQTIRERVAARMRAGGTDAWHILDKIGRECVGALQFTSGEAPEDATLEGEPMSDAQPRERSARLKRGRRLLHFHRRGAGENRCRNKAWPDWHRW